MKLETGKIVMSYGVNKLMNNNPFFYIFINASLDKFMNCDWGDTVPADAKSNDIAIERGDERILAVYNHPTHSNWKLWIITEADRSVTTILFPSEY